MRFEEFQKLLHPLTCFCGKGENRHAGADDLDIFVCGGGVELDRFGQVELGDYGDVRAIEDGGVFEPERCCANRRSWKFPKPRRSAGLER